MMPKHFQAIGYTIIYILASHAEATDIWDLTTRASQALKQLQSRADSCPSSNPVSCSSVDPKLPNNFCCSSGTTCISLDSSSSAICCPDGKCQQIKPFTCDVKLQDASSNKGPVFTTKLQDSLPTCAGQCCPFGYKCSGSDSNALCELDSTTAIFKNTTDAGSSPSTSTTIRTPTSSTTSSASPTSTSVNSIDSKNPPPSTANNKFPAGVFMAGFFPGIVIGILLTLAWVVLTGRHTKPTNRRGQLGSPDLGSTASFQKYESGSGYGAGSRPWISRPIVSAHSNERSDFLSRTKSRARSIFSLRRGNNPRTVDSVDMWNSKMPTPPAQSNIPITFISGMNDVPVTPARRVARYSNEEDEQSQRDTPHDMYQRNNVIERPDSTYASGAIPAVAPLRGMQTQRQRPISGSSLGRRDSGISTSDGQKGDFSRFGSPFQTPDKKTFPTQTQTQTANAGLTNLHNKTFHNITTLDNGSPIDRNPANNVQELPTLSSMTYTPPAATAAASAVRPRPPIPVTQPARPDTIIDDSDEISLHFDNPPPAAMQKPAKPSYNPHLLHSHTLQPNSHSVTCNDHDPRERDLTNKSKHTTNATTFTTMLREAGIPDPGNQMKQVPSVPKVPKGYL